MKRILLIARREWQAIIGSPSGLIVIALYLVVSGYMFSMTISMTHEATLRYTFASLGLLTIFIVPLITMRLLSEELRSGTFEILVSHPVTDIEIILGKFLAGWMAFVALSAPTLSYLLILQVFGAPDWGPALCGYLGQQLLAAMLIAMGLMISAMTASQVLAAMCAIVGGILFLLAGTAVNSIEGWLGRALAYLAMMDHFALFRRGVIDTRALVFFIATTLAFLYLAVRAVESRRWKFGTVPAGYFVRWKRPVLSIALAALALIFLGEAVIARTIHGMWTAYNSVFITMGIACGIMPLWLNRIRLGHLLSRNQIGLVLTVIINSLCVIAIWALVTFMTSQHYLRLDLTSSKQYALSEQTLNVIKQLALPIEIAVVMNSPADLKNTITDLLAEYKARSPRISIKDLDPLRNPGELEQLRQRFNLTSTLENEVVVIAGDRVRRIPLGALVNQKFRNVNGQMQPAAPPHFTGEAEITSAIIQLTGKSGGQVVFLTGHAERNLEESGNDGITFAVKQLANNGWHVEKQVIAPGANASFPTNTTVVVVAGPHQQLSNEDLKAIQEVLDRGGGLLALLDPGIETGMEPLLGPWNIRMADNLVVDLKDHVASADPSSLYVTMFNKDHPIGKGMGALAAVLPTCRRIAPYVGQSNLAVNVVCAPIMSTSGNSWAIAYQKGGEALKIDKTRDKRGPISLGVACERYQDVAEPGKNPLQGRMVVIGDSDFISNQYIDMAGNLNLFLNSIDWLAGRQELVSVRPKVSDFRMIAITTNQAKAMFWLSVAAVPGITILIGILAMINRRRRA